MLGGCLDSLRGQVDEVVVVDTGSVDATPEIATEHGARLLRARWTGDFSAARNVALDAATGSWILYIDADERLVPEPGTSLQEIVSKTGGYAAFQVKFRPRVGYSPYRELRLFRADPRIRFEGRIHEYVLANVRRVCESDGLTIGQADTEIQHLGYEGDLSRKHERNLPILARAVEDDPDRVYYWWHLGETQAATGDTALAVEALRTALDTAGRTGTERGRLEAVLAAHALARVHLEAGDASAAAAALDRGLEMRPENPALLLLKGRALIDIGQYDEALSLLTRLPIDKPDAFFDPDMAYDLRVFGEWPLDLIGVAEFRQAHYAEARDAFAAAAVAANSPDAAKYRAKATVAAARAKA